MLYTNGILLGIFSKDSFTPKNSIAGFTGSVIAGFNAGNLSGLKFNVTSTNAEQLGGVAAATYVRKDTANSVDGQFRITADLGLVVGSAGQANLTVTNGNVLLANAASDKNFTISLRKGITQEDAIVISGATRVVDIYSAYSDSQVNLGGSLTIQGDLTVEGTTTTVNTSSLTIEDKNIELAKNATTDTEADGGGITLKGATDHTLIWTEASSAWNSSEHINLAAGKKFKIDGADIVDETTFYGTSIPNVTSFGSQNVVNIGPGIPPVTYMRLQDNRISTVQSNLDIELEPDALGNVALIGDPRITGMADPVDQQDAATKEYVDDTIETRSVAFSMDLTDGKPNSYIVANVLNNLAPVAEYRNGAVARILCTLLSNNTSSVDINPLVSQSTATFNTPSGTAPAVTNVSIATASLPSQSITTTRILKQFQIIANTWTWVSDTILPA